MTTPPFNIQHSTRNTQHFGVYVHLPFCRVHCTYCPFAISTDLRLQDAYVGALLTEIDARGRGEPIDTLYLGGGTPSRTAPEHLRRIVERLRERFDVHADEFSIEANPEDVTPEALAFWRELGIDRISIGVQSFHDCELRPLGRVHGRERALAAVRDAVAGGARTSLDLILGLPGQTEQSFGETLDIAIASGAGHLSLYMLDLEEGTALAKHVAIGRTKLPDDELVASLYVATVERLAEAGLRQYEISNFGDPSLHNLRYWRREPYFGFGMSAHSFLGERRFANARDIRRYIADPLTPEFTEELGPGEQRREELFLHLRQADGIQSAEIERLCGREGTAWIERGLGDGWLRRDGERVSFTSSGFLLSNDYISQLF